MIREILKTIVTAGNDPTPPPQKAKRAGEPCVICGQPTQSFCGMCVRAGQARTSICTFEDGPTCQLEHAKDKHRDGQVAETDPNWVG